MILLLGIIQTLLQGILSLLFLPITILRHFNLYTRQINKEWGESQKQDERNRTIRQVVK